MPQLACNPILVNLTGLDINTFVKGSLSVVSMGRNKEVSETIPVSLRTNPAGAVDNFDLSPLIAAVCRQHFDGDKERYKYTFDNGYNEWRYTLRISGTDKATGTVLFGAGAVQEADLMPPYLLRRNTSTINVYKGLPGSFAQITPMNMMVFSEELLYIKQLKDNADLAVLYYTDNLALPVGKYYLVFASFFRYNAWDDARRWSDNGVWVDFYIDDLANAVVYPLVVHPSPADCLRSGAKIYVRYWNSRGTWSYALLDVLYNDLKAKTDYADAWRMDAEPVNGRIYGDRVQTEKEMTYTVTAGRDGLDRLDVDELRDMQRSYCVQVRDIDRKAWRDCYVKDATTRNAGGRGQEMTFTLEMPHEYTFTR